MGATLPAALLIAQELRQRAPEAAIGFGGPGCHGVDAALLERFPAVDAVARGEGEELVVEGTQIAKGYVEPDGCLL